MAELRKRFGNRRNRQLDEMFVGAKPASELNATQITAEEAAKLDDLAQELEEFGPDQNQVDKNAAGTQTSEAEQNNLE